MGTENQSVSLQIWRRENRMKVGIMSMQRIRNYGSYMQALGLKLLVEELGHQVEFVDYKADCIFSYRGTIKAMRSYRKLKSFVYDYQEKKKCAVFQEEQKKFLKDYENIYLKKLGITKKRKYHSNVDVLIIGSDEVFNCLQENPEVGYSLELFGHHNQAKKLISYAASFGNTTLSRLQECDVEKEIQESLKQFDALSVRDENSFHIVESLLGKKPSVHLDPVLVSDFSSCLKDTVTIRDYMIVYGYTGRFTKKEEEQIVAFAKKEKKKLVCVGGTQRFCEQYLSCAPEELLAYFAHADFIITETFHGTIFSIINRKPFVTIIRKSQERKYGNEEKLTDLLKRLQLEERILTVGDELENVMKRPMNYDATEKILQKEKKRTRAYLEEQL